MTTAAVKPIREGFHTITPYLIVQGAVELIDFVKQAFGAEELFRSGGSAGGIHAEVRIDDSIVMEGSKILGVYRISEGSVSESAVSPAKVIRGALLVNASAIILAHCHPSGHSHPSAPDRALTEDLVKTCDKMGMALVDHLVIANGSGYYSFADNGLIAEYRKK